MKKNIYIFSDGELMRKDNTIRFFCEEKQTYLPIEDISDIFAFGEVNITKKLLELLAQKEILLHYFNHYGYYMGTFYPREHYNSGYMILKQAAFYEEDEERLKLAKKFVEGSIYENKTDDFDKLDETISQWVDAVRKGRAMRYIPDNMIPYDDDLNPMKPNPFDNDFVALTNMMGEDEKGKIQTEQAEIRSAEYAATYSNDLDVCLQGIVSPSTLGIDLKKTDNAEAQREKEKTTLHTRKKIMKVLKKVVPRIIETTLKTYDVYKELPEREFEVNATFGEYAAPDFDSVVETIGKAKTYQIMSTKMAIDKLYNETLSDEEKAEELARIQEETSLNAVMDEPVLYDDGDQDEEKEEKEEKPKKDKKTEDQEKAKGE